MAHNEAYYKAESKIEQALKSGAMKLDFNTFDNLCLVTNTRGGKYGIY